MRILLVDDCTSVVESLGELLSLSHHDVDATDDSAHALELGLSKEYDILVTDYEMPGLNGLELAQKICESSSARIGVIVMTGSIETAVLHASPYVNKVLTKPFTCSVLRQAIAELGCSPTN